jgi:argininosuccinate lyase
MPFRSSHHVVGVLVRLAVGSGRRLSQLTPEELQDASPLLDPESFYALLGEGAWLEAKASRGGTGSVAVREQLARAREALERARGGR